MDIKQDSDDQYRQLFESHPHAILVYDLETLGFLAVNSAAIALYGYTREQFLALKINDLGSAKPAPLSCSRDESAIDTHRHEGRRTRRSTRDALSRRG